MCVCDDLLDGLREGRPFAVALSPTDELGAVLHAQPDDDGEIVVELPSLRRSKGRVGQERLAPPVVADALAALT